MPTTYQGLVAHIISIINIIIPTLFAVVFTYFVWKMIDSWVIHGGEETGREAGKRYAVSAVITFVIMVCAWGIVAMLKASFFG